MDSAWAGTPDPPVGQTSHPSAAGPESVSMFSGGTGIL